MPFVIVPSSLLFAAHKVSDPTFHQEMYGEVKESTKKSLLQRFKNEFGVKEHKLMEFFQAFLTASGWGKITIKDVNHDDHRAIISVSNSPIAAFYSHKSKEPVDTFLRGVFAGLFSTLFIEDMDCVETECSSMGEHSCQFVVKKKQDFDIANHLVQKQLKID